MQADIHENHKIVNAPVFSSFMRVGINNFFRAHRERYHDRNIFNIRM